MNLGILQSVSVQGMQREFFVSDHLDVMGLFDAIQSKDLNINSPSPSASDIACEEVEHYRKLLAEADHINLLKPENILP